jgi:hypothetical protein
MRLQLIWRGAKRFPADWDDACRNSLRGRQLPLTIEIADRKLTVIVDGRNQIEKGGIKRPIVVSLVNRDSCADFGDSFGNSDVEGFVGSGERVRGNNERLLGDAALPVPDSQSGKQGDNVGDG